MIALSEPSTCILQIKQRACMHRDSPRAFIRLHLSIWLARVSSRRHLELRRHRRSLMNLFLCNVINMLCIVMWRKSALIPPQFRSSPRAPPGADTQLREQDGNTKAAVWLPLTRLCSASSLCHLVFQYTM